MAAVGGQIENGMMVGGQIENGMMAQE